MMVHWKESSYRRDPVPRLVNIGETEKLSAERQSQPWTTPTLELPEAPKRKIFSVETGTDRMTQY
jgi:hypothetical protein